MLKSLGSAAFLAAIGIASAMTSVVPAVAQVRYAPRADAPIDFFSPYDESYGVSPSYQVRPLADGGVAVRVIVRCQYPNGWNVTDFGRDLNGIPNDASHDCPASAIGGKVRARY